MVHRPDDKPHGSAQGKYIFQPLHDSTVEDSNKSHGSFALGEVLPEHFPLLYCKVVSGY